MIGHGGWGRCQNFQKHFIIKKLLETYFVKKPRVNINLHWHVSGL